MHHPMARMPELYEAIKKSGSEYGAVDFGALAVDSMRIEKCYRGIGADLTNEISPLEAGLGRFVDMEKEDFVGREALVGIQKRGIAQQLIYVEVDARDADCIGGEPVYAEGRLVGVTSSGAFGHRTGRSLALAYVESGEAAPGRKLEVEVLEERRGATVLESEPAYDPANARLRA